MTEHNCKAVVAQNGRYSKSEKRKAHKKVWYAAHREECLAKMKIYYAANKKKKAAYYVAHREERAAYDKARYITHPREYRDYALVRKYGLSKAAFEALLIGQHSVCAICGKANWNIKGPCVDHNHITGQIRGLLCTNCNTALGLLHDDPKIVHAMGNYLECKKK
jgi:hypothetical protein